MSGFIELTDPDKGSKSLINTTYIVSIHKNGSGAMVSVIFGGLTKKYRCSESYENIIKTLK